jgi:hypothetical protein
MGSWGYEPFENDYAMEWLDNDVASVLLAQVTAKLAAFIQGGFEDDIEKHQAEAAVALLILFCDSGNTPIESACPINLYQQAKEQGVFDLAITTIQLLLQDTVWISAWSEPNEKQQRLEKLLRELRALLEAS